MSDINFGRVTIKLPQGVNPSVTCERLISHVESSKKLQISQFDRIKVSKDSNELNPKIEVIGNNLKNESNLLNYLASPKVTEELRTNTWKAKADFSVFFSKNNSDKQAPKGGIYKVIEKGSLDGVAKRLQSALKSIGNGLAGRKDTQGQMILMSKKNIYNSPTNLQKRMFPDCKNFKDKSTQAKLIATS